MAQITLTKENTYNGSLILVTPEFPLMPYSIADTMIPALEKQPEILIEKQAAKSLQELLTSIHCKNDIIAVSGFRTQEEQEQIWNDSIAENGLSFTQKFVAVPGHSEHQTGLAIDLAENKEDIDFICPAFPYTGIFQDFRQKATSFGFIERYMAGKESITGIGAEPWHFRYVGYPHSVIITEKNMALEEYIHFLKENTDFGHPYIYHSSKAEIEISYISLDTNEPVEIDIPEKSSYFISGTNEGGIIFSLWRKHNEH
ncbi:MAG: M15 family metallopeptidase [Lachnospiraceae bacterium]|nr:M15 family metallopeptidase [Lachnospiraceae bacterium]